MSSSWNIRHIVALRQYVLKSAVQLHRIWKHAIVYLWAWLCVLNWNSSTCSFICATPSGWQSIYCLDNEGNTYYKKAKIMRNVGIKTVKIGQEHARMIGLLNLNCESFCWEARHRKHEILFTLLRSRIMKH